MPRRPDAAAAVGVAAAGLVLLRLALFSFSDQFWGVNAIFYLGPGAVLVWTVLPLVALVPFIIRGSVGRLWSDPSRPWPAGAVGGAFLLLVIIFPAVGAPLLGDGIDRLEASMAGWRGLSGQPAPLDLILHLISYRIAAGASGESWNVAWQSWRYLSYLAGGFAAAAAWKVAALSAADRGGRAFVFFITLAGGGMLFFCGYVEDYVVLAAALFGFYALVLLVGQGRAPVWSLWLALVLLCGLHYFSALLLPALVLALSRSGLWRPSRGFTAAAAVALAGFSIFVLFVIREYYGGLAAIFVPPGQWLGGYHLLGFLNQQLLACPAWPVLLPLALAGKREGEDRPGVATLSAFLGAASLILLVFFFFLRPVIGPAGDWDLFAIPSLAYAPWLALRVLRRFGGRAEFLRVGWSAMVLTAAFTGPWLSANQNEPIAVDRYRDLLEWEAGHNPWAASYGYLRLGKYLGRRKFDQMNPEIVGSLHRAVAINPDSATIRRQVAEAFTVIGLLDEARREMAAHYRLMGRYYERKGSFAEAAEQYRAAVEDYGDTSPESRDGLRRARQQAGLPAGPPPGK